MRVAVLGLGSIGSRHARSLVALGHEVVGFDPRPASEGELWARASSPSEALAGVEAAVVATPTAMHAEHAVLALERGLPVLVEKPITVDPLEADRVVALAAQHGLTCGVAMNLRFHPGVLALRDLVSEGRLGEIRFAHVWCGSDLRTWRPGTDYRTSYSARADLGGGIVRDAIHELDYLTWMLGPAASVTAEVAHVSDLEIDVEDIGAALVVLKGGALASVDLTYIDPVYRRGCMLVGAEATARWDWTRGTVEISRPGTEVEQLDVAADVADTYVAEMRDFVEAAQTGRAPRTSAEEGRDAVRLADALLRSAAEGRRVTLLTAGQGPDAAADDQE
jgi:predicted dehydrogenase